MKEKENKKFFKIFKDQIIESSIMVAISMIIIILWLCLVLWLHGKSGVIGYIIGCGMFTLITPVLLGVHILYEKFKKNNNKEVKNGEKK